MAMYKFHLSDTNLVLISGFKSGYFSNIEVAMATQQAFRRARDEGAEVFPPPSLNFCSMPKRGYQRGYVDLC